MQYQPGSWYIPRGIPLQNMLTMPFPQPGSSNAATIIQYAAPNNSSLTCQILPKQQIATSQMQAGAYANAVAAAGTHNYQHTSFHPNAVETFPYGYATISTNKLSGNGCSIPHILSLGRLEDSPTYHPNNLLQSAAVAAMISPLALRSFLASSVSAELDNNLSTMPSQSSLSGSTQVMLQQPPTEVNTAITQLKCVPPPQNHQYQKLVPAAIKMNVDVTAMPHNIINLNTPNNNGIPFKKLLPLNVNEKPKILNPGKRKAEDSDQIKDLKKAKLETKALKAKRPGFTDERYHETSYFIENGLRKVYPYYFTFTTFTKGRWVGEKILDVFAREFRAHSAEEYERCIKTGTLTVNYEKVPADYKLKHNDLLANIVHRHEVPVTCQPITVVHMDDDIVVVNKPASIPVHPCGRYRHNTVVFILAKEYNLRNLRTIHRLDRLTSGLLLFGRSQKKARQMEHQIRNRQVQKEYICRVEGNFPEGIIKCNEAIEVVSYKIGVCKVSSKGKDCTTTFQKISYNGKTSVVLCKPLTGRMHQIRVHLQYLGYPVVNDPLYNHEVFGPLKGRGGDIGGKTDEELVRDLINIHNAENWLGIDVDSNISLFKTIKGDKDVDALSLGSKTKGYVPNDDDFEVKFRKTSPTCSSGPQFIDVATSNAANYNKVVNVGSNSCSRMKVESTVATQTGHESPDMTFNAAKMTTDEHCYECKVRYRDPKPKDLVMYLHAWKYKGPGWEYETGIPYWGSADWSEA